MVVQSGNRVVDTISKRDVKYGCWWSNGGWIVRWMHCRKETLPQLWQFNHQGRAQAIETAIINI